MRLLISVFVLFSFVLGGTYALAQSAASPEYRDPATATAISALVPGGGHFYAGESVTGVTLMATSVGAPLIGLALTARSEERICNGYECRTEVNLTPLLVGAAVTLGAYAYGLADAPRAADRANRRRGITTSIDVHPKIELRESRVAPGLALRFSL